MDAPENVVYNLDSLLFQGVCSLVKYYDFNEYFRRCLGTMSWFDTAGEVWRLQTKPSVATPTAGRSHEASM